MQFGGGYRYPSGWVFIVLSFLAVITTALIWYWKYLSPVHAFILLLSLEGTILLASAFSPIGLVPPPKGFIKKVRWFFAQQGGVPVSYNQVMFYGGLLTLAMGLILGTVSISGYGRWEIDLQDFPLIPFVSTFLGVFSAFLLGLFADHINRKMQGRRLRSETKSAIAAELVGIVNQVKEALPSLEATFRNIPHIDLPTDAKNSAVASGRYTLLEANFQVRISHIYSVVERMREYRSRMLDHYPGTMTQGLFIKFGNNFKTQMTYFLEVTPPLIGELERSVNFKGTKTTPQTIS